VRVAAARGTDRRIISIPAAVFRRKIDPSTGTQGALTPATPVSRRVTLQFAERLAWTAGIACLAVFGAVRGFGAWSAARDVAAFAASAQGTGAGPSRPDTSLWSPERIRAWQESQTRDAAVLAVLRIPKIKLTVPVLEGTDDSTLNRGVGHIEDTTGPGAVGNVGIAGHRDGFFRGLKDVAAGDALDMDVRGRTEHYRVEHIWIVEPEDVWVIDPTPGAAVTLVTCYPFYYIGAAPQRYIVRAVPATQLTTNADGTRQDGRSASSTNNGGMYATHRLPVLDTHGRRGDWTLVHVRGGSNNVDHLGAKEVRSDFRRRQPAGRQGA
jgi:sortase A